jgi:hypothetical protein
MSRWHTVLASTAVDQEGRHASKGWRNRKKRYAANHPTMRCRACLRRPMELDLLSYRKGRLYVLHVGHEKPDLHELRYDVPPEAMRDQDLMWLCKKHHIGNRNGWIPSVHEFDKMLFPWDRKNRFLWLSTRLYIAGWRVGQVGTAGGVVGFIWLIANSWSGGILG